MLKRESMNNSMHSILTCLKAHCILGERLTRGWDRIGVEEKLKGVVGADAHVEDAKRWPRGVQRGESPRLARLS